MVADGLKTILAPPSASSRQPSGKVAVVTDVDAHLADGGVEDGVAEVAGPEVELLPETLHLGDVVLAVLAQEGAVGVDHRRRVVVGAFVDHLEHRYDQHHPGLLGQGLHEVCGRTRHGFGVGEVRAVLHGAEVRGGEDLLEAQHLGTLVGSLPGIPDLLVDHRLLVPGPFGLNEGSSDGIGHDTP